MAVYFKFKAAKDFDSINIDGPFITVGDLKEKIIEQKHLGSATDFDLVILNAQTAEEFLEDSQLVPKNTSVIIKRVPAVRPRIAKPRTVEVKPTAQQSPIEPSDDFGEDILSIPLPAEIPKVETGKGLEDEAAKLAAILNQQSADWQKQTHEPTMPGRGGYGRGTGRGVVGGRFGFAGRGTTPPEGYVCHRCREPGHFIQHCPTNGDPNYDMRRMKPVSGIPRTRLQADEGGSLVSRDGRVVKFKPDEVGFLKEAGALLQFKQTTYNPPAHLTCPVDKKLFEDAVLITCCSETFCDKCLRDSIIKGGKCPGCLSTDSKTDDIRINKRVREAVEHFKESVVAEKAREMGFAEPRQSAQILPTPAMSVMPGGLPPKPANQSMPAARPVTATEPGKAEMEVGAEKKAEENGAEIGNGVKVALNGEEKAGVEVEKGVKVGEEAVGVEDGVEREKEGSPNNFDTADSGAKAENLPRSEAGEEGKAEEEKVDSGSREEATGEEELQMPVVQRGTIPCPNCGSFEHPPWECPLNFPNHPMPYPPPYGMYGPGYPRPPFDPNFGPFWGGPPRGAFPPFPMGFDPGMGYGIPPGGMYPQGPRGGAYPPMFDGPFMGGARPPAPHLFPGGVRPPPEELAEFETFARKRNEMAAKREHRRQRALSRDLDEDVEVEEKEQDKDSHEQERKDRRRSSSRMGEGEDDERRKQDDDYEDRRGRSHERYSRSRRESSRERYRTTRLGPGAHNEEEEAEEVRYSRKRRDSSRQPHDDEPSDVRRSRKRSSRQEDELPDEVDGGERDRISKRKGGKTGTGKGGSDAGLEVNEENGTKRKHHKSRRSKSKERKSSRAVEDSEEKESKRKSKDKKKRPLEEEEANDSEEKRHRKRKTEKSEKGRSKDTKSTKLVNEKGTTAG